MGGPRPTDVPGVIARMEEIVAACPPGDGVGWFTRLYLQVTRSVGQAMEGVAFKDQRFLGHLDVVFAGLFFHAYDAAAAGHRIPPAWKPLFEQRAHEGIAPIQFALAGMNAHINRDLPVALTTSCTDLELELAFGSPEHADYERVNGLLAQTETQVKQWFVTGILGEVDHLVGKADDRIAMWDIARARDFAWTQAETLWALRHAPLLAKRFIDGLDHVVGFAGRGLLLPVA